MVKQAQKSERLYVEGYEWTTEQQKIDKGFTDVKPESFYMLPTAWPILHPVHQGSFRYVTSPVFLIMFIIQFFQNDISLLQWTAFGTVSIFRLAIAQ